MGAKKRLMLRRYRALCGYSNLGNVQGFWHHSLRDQSNQKIKRMGESLKPSRCSDSVLVPQQQSQIHPGDMDQQSLQNVVVFSQVRSPHAAGLITVCEGPLDQLTTFPQKSLALRPLQRRFPACFFSGIYVRTPAACISFSTGPL